MLSSNIFGRYLYIFYLFGLSAYNPRNNLPVNGFAIIRKSMPSMFFVLIILLSGVMSFDHFTSVKINLNNCLHAIFVLLMVVTGLTAFKRSSFLRGDTKYIWKYLLNLETLILKRFHLDINFTRFVVVYNRKLICMVFLLSCLAAFKFYHRIDASNAVRQIGVINLTLITLGVNFYTLFYIDLFNFIFETINKHTMMNIDLSECDNIVIDVKNSNLSEQIIQLFQILKLLHFKLWKIVRIMNYDLGGTLTLLIIQNTNTSIQTFYWIIFELYEDDLTQNIRIIST